MSATATGKSYRESPSESYWQGCVHNWFERQAALTPERTAIRMNGGSLSYGALNARSNQMAWRLKSLGVGLGTPVGICLERSLDLMIAVYAVLKAGAMYVPLDPSYPESHLSYMLESLECQVLIRGELGGSAVAGQRHSLRVAAEEDAEFSEGNPPPESRPTDLIYTIFTSGSTGRPKGAAVYHRGFANLVRWYIEEFRIGSSDRALLVSSFSFDLTQKNLFATLAAGGTLHLLQAGPFDPAALSAAIRGDSITLLNCTPSTAYPLFEEADPDTLASFQSLRCLFLGGEAIAARRLRRWTASAGFSCQVVNTYGPTECSDISAFHILQPAELAGDGAIPIGLPIWNTDLAVVDENMLPCVAGASGELLIAGQGVGAGYITNTQLNAARFLPNPLPEVLRGATVYRTGDLARRRSDGLLEFLGRADHQVKIRGFRIELGEIEATLEAHDAVKSAAVVPKTPASGTLGLEASTSLAAYVTGFPRTPIDTAGLRRFLRSRLPEHMVPATITVLDRLPLSPNGKVDRRALLESEGPSLEAGFPKPADTEPESLQLLVVGVWRAVLKTDRADFDENFFDAGGDSLLAIEMQRRLALAIPGCGVSVTTLFEHSTLRALCRQLESNLEPAPASSVLASGAEDRAKRRQQALLAGHRRNRATGDPAPVQGE